MRVSRGNQNVMRDVLAFLFRHWRREAWLVTGVACSMVVATIADLFMPVFAGRMVDAIATHGATHRQALHAAISALAWLYSVFARSMSAVCARAVAPSANTSTSALQITVARIAPAYTDPLGFALYR